jgi:hypothetical protein
MSNVRILRSAMTSLILIASFQVASSASAQNPRPERFLPMPPEETANRTALADALRAKAQPLIQRKSTWAEGARLLQQAAEMRVPTDPAYVWDMFTAALVFLNAGKRQEALQAMVATAQRGCEVTDVRKCAHAYLNAAVLARRLGGREEEAMNYVLTAAVLAWHPKTPDLDREEILGRIKKNGRKVLGEPDWIP